MVVINRLLRKVVHILDNMSASYGESKENNENIGQDSRNCN